MLAPPGFFRKMPHYLSPSSGTLSECEPELFHAQIFTSRQ